MPALLQADSLLTDYYEGDKMNRAVPVYISFESIPSEIKYTVMNDAAAEIRVGPLQSETEAARNYLTQHNIQCDAVVVGPIGSFRFFRRNVYPIRFINSL